MKILAIDPGSTESSYAIINMPQFYLHEFGKVKNEELLSWLKHRLMPLQKECDIAIEMIASYGMPVGKDVFETCVWIGRFAQALEDKQINYIYRKNEKITLCGSMKAKDTNIKQALINRYARFDFKSGKGTKNKPDIFYGVSKDVWQAIAVGVTYGEGVNN